MPGTRLAEANPERVAIKRQQMNRLPYLLDLRRRATVLDALREVCLHCGWSLWAAHVRTNHIHSVVEADVRPEKIMHAFKSYASRNLNLLGIDEPDRKRWARHGSTRWLWNDEDVQKAIYYVVSGQGEPMEVHQAQEYSAPSQSRLGQCLATTEPDNVAAYRAAPILDSGRNSSTSNEFRITARNSSSDPICPVPIACVNAFPAAVASAGPAITTRPVTSAVN